MTSHGLDDLKWSRTAGNTLFASFAAKLVNHVLKTLAQDQERGVTYFF